MARRKVRDEREARALVEEARRRGVRPSVVSRERGINGRSAQAWSMTLAKKDKPTASQALGIVELVPIDERPEPVYRVWVGDLSIELTSDFEPLAVQRLVAVLRTC